LADYVAKFSQWSQHKKNRKEAKALLQKAYEYEAQGNIRAHVSCLLNALKLDSDLDEAHNALAWTLYLMRKQLDKALFHAKKAVELKPENPNYYDTLGEVYFASGDLDKSFEITRESYNLSSSKDFNIHYLANHRIARINLSKGNPSEAINAFSNCLKINKPNSSFDIAGVFYGLAMAFQQIGNNDKAIECAQKDQMLRPCKYFSELVISREKRSEVQRPAGASPIHCPPDRELPPGQELTGVDLVDWEIDPAYLLDRGARLDVLARTKEGALINIEIQVANQYNIDKRTMFYWAGLYHGQLTSGQRFADLRRTITINILGFDWFRDRGRYHHVFHIREDETGQLLNDDLEIHFLELEKIKTLRHKPKDRLEAWMMYLNNFEGEEMEAIAMENPGIRKALTIEKAFWQSKRERRLYELREKAMRDELSMLAGARAEGEAKGKADGTTK